MNSLVRLILAGVTWALLVALLIWCLTAVTA